MHEYYLLCKVHLFKFNCTDLLIQVIITVCCRSCEKMNVVKDNKDLACFYTTKHSWRGK